MSLRNKVIIVTGASSGIGAATAIILAKQDAHVVLVGRNQVNLNNVAEKCGEKAFAIKADVSKDDDAADIIEKTIQKFGKVDVLINNAGIFRTSSISDDTYVEVFDEVMRTNVRSVMVLTKLAVTHLVKTKGIIINVSSVAGTVAFAEYSAYCTSKAALKHYSKVIAAELAGKGVRVIIISPGPVDTPIFDSLGNGAKVEDFMSYTALNSITKPEEIGELISFVASDKLPSVTGSEFVVDCGFLIKK